MFVGVDRTWSLRVVDSEMEAVGAVVICLLNLKKLLIDHSEERDDNFSDGSESFLSQNQPGGLTWKS